MFGHSSMSFWPPLPAPGSGGALSQDTLLNYDTPLSFVGGGGGTVPTDLIVSTLTIAGGPNSIQLEPQSIGGIGEFSGSIIFNGVNNQTAAQGQLGLNRSNMTSVSQQSEVFGLSLTALSTGIGAFQPFGSSDIFIYSQGTDVSNYAYTLEATNTPVSSLNIQAPAVNISTLIGVSSINGLNWARISTVIAAAP